ncbi:DNA repair protein RadC [Belliella kenyensis]|uniref:DNA repair protein RadC n=1 Tax=Belliella kenyensis TaxID=1472724 RepID=A0ABV8EHH8_9BACT|nr:DNA repair protein RadC [Belliella kenyensis]MCH7403479.1 DNA repair protein RadC [Belliella kenyensis]MDN3602379.1 DNA repair protein RadC [Belliella kenyensis]
MDTYQSIKISMLSEEDRPREKLLLKGKSALSDAELIAILIGSGTKSISAVDLSRFILSKVNNNLGELARLSVKDLQQFKGIGEAKAIAIVSALELGRRRKLQEPTKKDRITSSVDAYQIMTPYLQDEIVENFWVIYLNRNNYVIKKQLISKGGSNATIADPKMIFKYALELMASSMILVHNHPSGSLSPSRQDIALTDRLKLIGQNLEVSVLDHLIFTDSGYFSFADEGKI